MNDIKMRLLIILFFASCVFAKINMKALTESLGQEVIEIGAPIRELPPDIDEEPAAENEGETTAADIKVATPKEKVLKKSDPSKKTKDVDKIDGRKQEDEEARIEKELADIYKDSIDYKPESAEVSHEENATELSEKPIARVRTNFQFQPDSNNPEDIARFRTSVDDINCDRIKLSGVKLGNRDGKKIDKEKGVEKELAEDKESYDYESENAYVFKVNATDLAVDNDKVARAGKTTKGFWFGPDSTDPKDLARFRTSQNYMNCDILKMSGEEKVATSGFQELFKDTVHWVMICLTFIYMI